MQDMGPRQCGFSLQQPHRCAILNASRCSLINSWALAAFLPSFLLLNKAPESPHVLALPWHLLPDLDEGVQDPHTELAAVQIVGLCRCLMLHAALPWSTACGASQLKLHVLQLPSLLMMLWQPAQHF